MALFLATFVNKVDKKGRVSVPATFRAALSQPSYAGVIAFRSFTVPCIEGRGMDWMERVAAGTDDMAAFSPEQDELTQLIFANSRQLPFDPEGRVVLPEEMMAHAGITEAAAFVGKGKTFQVWEPEAYRRVEEETLQRAMKMRSASAVVKNGEAR
ncbi:MAG: division/cell wall cluster transcriptional repressor MraZ [Alphaproteobacteria bacterium]|nr:division/cell wall cluster transcriptional repressor MraZ [Alphaproteobacteria bacterium]